MSSERLLLWDTGDGPPDRMPFYGAEDAGFDTPELHLPQGPTESMPKTQEEYIGGPLTDSQEILAAARSIREQLQEILQEQSNTISTNAPSQYDMPPRILRELGRALNAAEQGNWSDLGDYGIHCNPGWLYDMALSVVKGRPIDLQVAYILPPLLAYTGPDQQVFSCDRTLDYQQGSLRFAATLRKIQGLEALRPVVEIGDLPTRDMAINAVHRWYMLRHATQRLRNAGVIREADIPGKDYLFISHSYNALGGEELYRQLGQAEGGQLVTYKDGCVYMRPDERILQSVTYQHAEVSEKLGRDGVLLQYPNGNLTAAATRAAGYLDSPGSRTFIRIQDASTGKSYQSDTGTAAIDLLRRPRSHELSTLLQALDIAYPDQDQYLYYDSYRLSPQYVEYALTRLLHHGISMVCTNLEKITDVRDGMKPRDYFLHNYNDAEGVWQVDVQGVQAIANELPKWLKPGEVESAAVIGYGPFTYPALSIVPYMLEGARIDISDLLQKNIDFAQQWFDNRADPEQEHVYQQFANIFRNTRVGNRYQDCEERLRKLAELRTIALENIESDSAQVVIEAFVSCSRDIAKHGFYNSIRQKARIMTWTPHSMMISVHMVGSGGWNNSGDHEGIVIPASRLSLDDIRNGYNSAGLQVVKEIRLDAGKEIRDDYDCIVVVFAKPATLKKPRFAREIS